MIILLFFLGLATLAGLAILSTRVQLRGYHARHAEHRRALAAQLAREDRLDPRQIAYEDAVHRRELEREKQAVDLHLARLDMALKWWFRDIGSAGTIMPESAAYQVIAPMRNGKQPELEQAPPPAQVQTFRELLQTGTLTAALSHGKLLLGYTDGELRYGSWLDLYSCAIGGVPGSGKTTTVRFLLFQGILAGAHLVMIDPHIHEPEESLAAQFQAFQGVHIMDPCDSTPALVLKRVRFLLAELEARKAKGQKTPAIVFVLDEFNAVMRVQQVRDEMSNLLLSIEQEGRKFGLFAMLIGQRWSHDDIGGADIRSSLASILAHRFVDQDQAKKLIGGKAAAKCLELPVGSYLFRDTGGGLSLMTTPLTTADDGQLVARMISGFNPVATDFQRAPVSPADESELQTTAVSVGPALDARSAQVRAMLREGFTPPQIVRELWKVSSGGAYTKAMEELSAIISRLV